MKQNIDSKLNLAIMFGGRCVEHEISVISALQMIKALDDRKYTVIPVYIAPDGKWYTGEILLDRSIYRRFNSLKSKLQQVTMFPEPGESCLRILKSNQKIPVDVFFPIFHGEYGEDGCMQGLFELADVSYTGFGVMASAVTMNKYITKLALRSIGVPVLDAQVIKKFEFLKNSEVNLTLDYPVFVKPCNRGSSVGISKARNKEELRQSLLNVFKYDLEALIEPLLEEMFEINVAVLDALPAITSAVEIPHTDTGLLSYEEKYMRPGTKKSGESEGMASLTRVINPKDLNPETEQAVRDYAIKTFQELGFSGNCRIDFMYDTKQSKLYLTEVNPLPGSLAFYLWAESNPELLYTDLIDQIIEAALRQKRYKASLSRFIGLRAL